MKTKITRRRYIALRNKAVFFLIFTIPVAIFILTNVIQFLAHPGNQVAFVALIIILGVAVMGWALHTLECISNSKIEENLDEQ